LRKERVKRGQARQYKRDYQQVYGEAFITKLLSGMKIKAYNEKLKDKQQKLKDANKKHVNRLVENFTHKL
jgi:hypothetical protein